LSVFFVRHGESMANVADRDRVRRPPDWDRLSPAGWEQARSLGRRLRGEGIEALVASPLRRAQETAQAVAGEIGGGIAVETDDDLIEVRQGDAYDAAAPDFGATGTITWMPRYGRHHREPGAESFQDIADRVTRVQERFAQRARSERFVAVTHWGFLHFFLGMTMFQDAFGPEHLMSLYRLSHANTGISVFEHRETWDLDGMDFSGWVMTTWNDRASL
jgi:broad specificity phosphatase PhoE